MLGLDQIIEMNKEAMEKAEQDSLQPYVATVDGDDGVRSAPSIGDYIPDGWKPTKVYFVDSSRLGAPDERALTFNQFLTQVKKGYGYAICGPGQFQVYIQEFEVN